MEPRCTCPYEKSGLTRSHLQPPPISQTASGSTAVLEYRPAETLPVLAAMLLDLARLFRHCRPARPQLWRKKRAFPGSDEKSGERQTVCWRELDSKFQYAREFVPVHAARTTTATRFAADLRPSTWIP